MNVELIRAWIKQHNPQGITKLAAKLEMSPSAVQKIATGTNTPSVETLKKLQAVLSVDWSDLLGKPIKDKTA